MPCLGNTTAMPQKAEGTLASALPVPSKTLPKNTGYCLEEPCPREWCQQCRSLPCIPTIASRMLLPSWVEGSRPISP